MHVTSVPGHLATAPQSPWWRLDLLRQLVARDVAQRHRGSILGGLWALVQPLALLAIFTFVLTQVFRARWPGAPEGAPVQFFAVMLFCGTIVFTVFSEALTRACTVIVVHANLVKRVVFPIELLPVVPVLSALVSAAYGVVALVIVSSVVLGPPPVTALLVPIPMVPLLLWSLGLAWLLAALGVFLRDLTYGIGIALQALYFLSPVLFPPEQVPGWAQPLVRVNPLSEIIGETRGLLVHGVVPVWWRWAAVVAAGLAVDAAGLLFFRRTKRAFADVL